MIQKAAQPIFDVFVVHVFDEEGYLQVAVEDEDAEQLVVVEHCVAVEYVAALFVGFVIFADDWN